MSTVASIKAAYESMGLIALAVVSYILFTWIVYPGFLSPLARLPNAHVLSPYTSTWIQWSRLQGREVDEAYKAFRAKGPVVRLAPNEVAVNVIDGGTRTVHGGGFEKPDYYNNWTKYGCEIRAIP